MEFNYIDSIVLLPKVPLTLRLVGLGRLLYSCTRHVMVPFSTCHGPVSICYVPALYKSCSCRVHVKILWSTCLFHVIYRSCSYQLHVCSCYVHVVFLPVTCLFMLSIHVMFPLTLQSQLFQRNEIALLSPSASIFKISQCHLHLWINVFILDSKIYTKQKLFNNTC